MMPSKSYQPCPKKWHLCLLLRIAESPFAEIVFLNSCTKDSERTGTLHHPIGRFEAVNGGTIVLDEIGELRPDCRIP
jgi:hypothetical protein